MSDLLTILTRYEGAVSDVERDGNTSDEAMEELAQARADLMKLLEVAAAWEQENLGE